MTVSDLITESDYAAAHSVSVRTVQRERAQLIWPPFIKLGRNIYYRPAAIEKWLLAQEQVQPCAKCLAGQDMFEQKNKNARALAGATGAKQVVENTKLPN